jgi:hypothetical protein
MSVSQDFTQRSGNILNTTAATANQVITTTATVEDQGYAVIARIYGVSTDNFDEGFFYELKGFFLNDGGTLAIVGAVAQTVNIESAAATPTMVATAGNIEVRITPADTTPITWRADLEIQAVQQYIPNGGYAK